MALPITDDDHIQQREAAADYDNENTIRSSCPICGAALQATEKTYYSDVVLNENGEIISSNPTTLDTDQDIYCANDHTLREMLEAL